MIWFLVLENGANLEFYALWAWATGLLSVGIAWIPVIIGYGLHFIDSNFTNTNWLVVTLLSIDGPMIGYVAAVVIIIIGYFKPVNSGIIYSSEWHYWLGVSLGISFTAMSITL